jgi:hypothetical protein
MDALAALLAAVRQVEPAFVASLRGSHADARLGTSATSNIRRPETAPNKFSSPHPSLAVGDVTLREARVVANSNLEVGEAVGYGTWATSGRWVFFAARRPEINVYGVGSKRACAAGLPEGCDCFGAYVAS